MIPELTIGFIWACLFFFFQCIRMFNFIAYSDESGAKLFTVSYDKDTSKIVVDATIGNGHSAEGGTTSAPVTGTRWHLIEFSWESGLTGSLWVDADATSDSASETFASGTGTVESVPLSAPNGFGTLTGMAF